MNEQEFQQRRIEILDSIERHVPTGRPALSEKALGRVSRLTGALMLAPAVFAGAWSCNNYWLSLSAAAQTSPPYFSALLIFLATSLMFSIALFFIVTLAQLNFGYVPIAASLNFFGPFAAARRSIASAVLGRFGLGCPIAPIQAGQITVFVAANPRAMDTVSSWASKTPSLEFTSREVSCIARVSRRLAKLDAQWATVQDDVTRRQEINQLLEESGIAARVTSLAQSDSMSAATPPAQAPATPSASRRI